MKNYFQTLTELQELQSYKKTDSDTLGQLFRYFFTTVNVVYCGLNVYVERSGDILVHVVTLTKLFPLRRTPKDDLIYAGCCK